jgi:hypothetical protein
MPRRPALASALALIAALLSLAAAALAGCASAPRPLRAASPASALDGSRAPLAPERAAAGAVLRPGWALLLLQRALDDEESVLASWVIWPARGEG